MILKKFFQEYLQILFYASVGFKQKQIMRSLSLLLKEIMICENIVEAIILNQDKRPVITERPKRTELRVGEKMIPGDGPIVEYRRRREELTGKS